MVDINATTPQLKVVKALFEGYCDLELENVLPLLSKDYRFQTFPKIPTHPDETKERHAKKYGRIMALLVNVDSEVLEVIEAPGKVVTHIRFTATTADATPLEYESVVIHTLVEEDGELKILETKDFSDPHKRGKLHDWVFRALGKNP